VEEDDVVGVRFPETHTCNENGKFKTFSRVSRIILDIYEVI
jgi:hypothetical protein